MHITALVENHSRRSGVEGHYGLSLYIVYREKKILFDFGPDKALLANSKKMGIDLASVDWAILSHAHRDHSGGIADFLSVNTHAPIYVRPQALEECYYQNKDTRVYVGLDRNLHHHPQMVLIDHSRIEPGAMLVHSVKGRRFYAQSNQRLRRKVGADLVADDFSHEHSLLLEENGSQVLIAGCGHTGILNIWQAAARLSALPIRSVVGGFHLSDGFGQAAEPPKLVHGLARALSKTGSCYYTCHCTGEAAYPLLRKHLGERLHVLHAGEEVVL